jgi:hypothetical protein
LIVIFATYGAVAHYSDGELDQAAITGESLPLDNVAGDEVFAGTSGTSSASVPSAVFSRPGPHERISGALRLRSNCVADDAKTLHICATTTAQRLLRPAGAAELPARQRLSDLQNLPHHPRVLASALRPTPAKSATVSPPPRPATSNGSPR